MNDRAQESATDNRISIRNKAKNVSSQLARITIRQVLNHFPRVPFVSSEFIDEFVAIIHINRIVRIGSDKECADCDQYVELYSGNGARYV